MEVAHQMGKEEEKEVHKNYGSRGGGGKIAYHVDKRETKWRGRLEGSKRRRVSYGSTTIRLRTFRLRHFVYRHFVYRHFVYYCIPACRTVRHPTSVSANHYFHQFQLLLTL